MEMHPSGSGTGLTGSAAATDLPREESKRRGEPVCRLAAFFDLVQQDPVVSQVKLIAEPWDVGPGGYQVGNFPVLWSEWNGIYRDVVRDFWRGQASVGEFASRFTGSSDLYESDGRQPFASINLRQISNSVGRRSVAPR
jgi:pullulanase/glycogen debranching enzyme